MPMLAGHDYHAEIASDLTRDGISLELSEQDGEVVGEVVAEVFYSDVTGTMTFTTYRPDLPLEAVEWLIQQAKACLPPGACPADP